MNVLFPSAFRAAAPAPTARVYPYGGLVRPGGHILHQIAPTTRYIPRRTITAGPSVRRPKNEAIPFPIVCLVDPETKTLRPPEPLKSILASIENRKTHHVELVSEHQQPVVKIVDTKEAARKYKEQRKQAKVVARAQEHKEIQLTWGVASGDLDHKLNKVRQELEKGRRVDLIFAPKRGQVVPTKQNMDARLKEISDALSDVGKEYLPRDERNNIIALHLKPL